MGNKNIVRENKELAKHYTK